ncbi:MAG: FliM/FliN family flagellar motor switch protein [Phycisphaerales bacterium]|jgi:flagellar motor switch protein FliN/FliY|nr:FliM/FliN family flagellar motor switch protein [Phycisphaerales bacterium]
MRDVKRLKKLDVPFKVRLAERRMSLREVLALCPGAIIELPKKADEELDVLINNKHVGFGLAVKIGENFGVRITYIGDINARVAALGKDGKAEGEGPTAEELAEALLTGQV